MLILFGEDLAKTNLYINWYNSIIGAALEYNQFPQEIFIFSAVNEDKLAKVCLTFVLKV